nr:MAG: nonstructural protein [Microvirus sp.]
MDFELYSIKDRLAEEYGPVFQAKNKAIAERNFNNLVEREKLNEDEFSLVLVGHFNNNTGVLTTV